MERSYAGAFDAATTAQAWVAEFNARDHSETARTVVRGAAAAIRGFVRWCVENNVDPTLSLSGALEAYLPRIMERKQPEVAVTYLNHWLQGLEPPLKIIREPGQPLAVVELAQPPQSASIQRWTRDPIHHYMQHLRSLNAPSEAILEADTVLSNFVKTEKARAKRDGATFDPDDPAALRQAAMDRSGRVWQIVTDYIAFRANHPEFRARRVAPLPVPEIAPTLDPQQVALSWVYLLALSQGRYETFPVAEEAILTTLRAHLGLPPLDPKDLWNTLLDFASTAHHHNDPTIAWDPVDLAHASAARARATALVAYAEHLKGTATASVQRHYNTAISRLFATVSAAYPGFNPEREADRDWLGSSPYITSSTAQRVFASWRTSVEGHKTYRARRLTRPHEDAPDNEWIAEFNSRDLGSLAPSTRAKIQTEIRKFARWIDEQEKLDPTEFRKNLQSYIDSTSPDGVARAGLNQWLNGLPTPLFIKDSRDPALPGLIVIEREPDQRPTTRKRPRPTAPGLFAEHLGQSHSAEEVQAVTNDLARFFDAAQKHMKKRQNTTFDRSDPLAIRTAALVYGPYVNEPHMKLSVDAYLDFLERHSVEGQHGLERLAQVIADTSFFGGLPTSPPPPKRHMHQQSPPRPKGHER